MKLAFCPWFELIVTEIQVVVDVTVEWEDGTPYLIANDVLEIDGNKSLIRCGDKLMESLAFRIMDMAEDDSRLLERAVEQDNDEREAA